MSNVLIDRQKIDILANAISDKSGVPVTMTLDEMVEAVDGIEAGSAEPVLQSKTYTVDSAGTETITADSGYDGLSSVSVSVPSAYYEFGAVEGNFYTDNNVRKWRYRAMLEKLDSGYIEQGEEYSNYRIFSAVPSNTTITPTESSQTIGGADYMMEGAVTVNAIPSNYVGSGITQRSSSDLTASGATVTVPSGYYSAQASKAVSSGSASPASTISATGASVSTGTNTLTLSKTVSNTPTVSAGYISSGTAGNSSVSLTASVTTQAAQTIYPSTSDQTINSGRYLTGNQTIKAVTTSNLTAENIKSGVTVTVGDSADADRVASVTGTYTGGGSGKNAQTVQQSGTRIASTTYGKACGDITVSKAGTYDVYWSAYRTSTSGTWGTRLYINSAAASGTAGTEQTTFVNSYYQAVHLSNVSLSKNDVVSVYGKSRGTNYYLYVGQLTIIEA